MADPIWEFDPVAEATGSPLVISTGNYGVTSFSAPSPPAKSQWASSTDTEGGLLAGSGHENRTITIQLEVTGDAALATLQGKVAKVHRDAGTLKYTDAAGASVVYDVRIHDGWERQFDHLHYLGGVTSVQFSLTCAPYSRGASVLQTDRIETTLPCLIATETGVTGDVPGGGLWTIDNDAAAGSNWWGLLWGIEQNTDYTFTDSTGSGALYYEAESRTALGGSAIAVGPAGASGAGSNVMRNTTLTTTPVAILSTQATGGGAHLTHVGSFRVLARVQTPATNTGQVSVGFEWGVGDFKTFQRNADEERALDPAFEGTWRLLDLGYVTIPKALTGSVRWEGRIVASSTVASDDIDVDCLFILPYLKGWGRAQGVLRLDTPTTFSARDEFDQVAGALNGKTLPVGGTWATSGAASDWNVNGSGQAVHITNGDRVGVAGAATFTNVVVRCDMSDAASSGGGLVGVRARGGLNAYVARTGSAIGQLTVEMNSPTNPLTVAGVAFVSSTTYTMTLYVDAAGRFAVWWAPAGSTPGSPLIKAQRAQYATGGANATGTVGIVGGALTGGTGPRVHDNFAVWVPPVDAAVFGGQSLQVRDNGVIREDSAGTFWQDVSDFEGKLLRVPPAGAEALSTRMFAKPIYHPEDSTGGSWLDDRIDDISGRLTFIPRYL